MYSCAMLPTSGSSAHAPRCNVTFGAGLLDLQSLICFQKQAESVLSHAHHRKQWCYHVAIAPAGASISCLIQPQQRLLQTPDMVSSTFLCALSSRLYVSEPKQMLQAKLLQLTRVGVCEQGAHGQENLADCQSWAPLILENIQAYLAIAVDVAMINASPENYLHQDCHDLHQQNDPFTFTANHASLGSPQCNSPAAASLTNSSTALYHTECTARMHPAATHSLYRIA